MLNYYFVYYTTKLDGKTLRTTRTSCICEEHEAKDEIISINWQNLTNFYCSYGFVSGFSVSKTKKGQYIKFSDRAFNSRKEWKHSETGLTLEITHRVYEPSIQTILDWSDQKKAIQYLNERNLRIGA